jgi:hypothetical protein
MGIRVNWDNDEQTIILCAFDGRWSWNDLYTALDTVQEMSDSVDHRVDAIINFSKADLIPSGSIFSLDGKKQAQKLASKASEARGLIVIAGANAFIRGVYDTFRMFDKNISSGVYFVDSVKHARSLLLERQTIEQKAVC